MVKIAYCAGHGGFGVTPGKRTPAGEYEWDFNNKNARAFEIEMMQYENVQLLRTDDPTGRTDVSLGTRVQKSKDFGAQLYLSFHHNANKGVWGDHTGTETLVYALGTVAHTIAKKLHAAMVSAYQIRDRGIIPRGDSLAILRDTKCPAVIFEGGFMDSTIDIVKLRDDSVLTLAGRLVAVEVAKHFGLKRKETSSPMVEEPKEIESVQILTGGLVSENAKLFIDFCMEQGWWAEVRVRKGVNPRGLTGGLDPVNRKAAEDFLNAKGWGYAVYNKGEVPN